MFNSIYGVILHYRYQASTSKKSQPQAYGPSSAQPALPPDEVHRLCREYKNQMSLSESEIERIQVETKDQANDTTGTWFNLRRSRITSSNFGVVCKRRQSTPVGNLVKTLLYSSSTINSPSLRWGQENEDLARRSYLQEMEKLGKKISIEKIGLIISNEKPHLSCSPDNFVVDYSADPSEGIVEYKCPYSARHLTPAQSCAQLKNFCSKNVNENLELKTNHNYYYQIQGVMAITRRKWCDFVIWTPKGTSIERIQANHKFWLEMVPKLDSFWNKAVLPELAAPEYPHKRPIREPGTWEKQ